MSKSKEIIEGNEAQVETGREAAGKGRVETFLDHLLLEHREVGDRRGKLKAFMDGPSYQTLDQEERERLAAQFVAMGHYYGILAARIAYHQAKGTK